MTNLNESGRNISSQELNGIIKETKKVQLSTTAYIVPGQGSQSVGMGLDLYNSSAAARATFEEADDILGFKLSRLCFEGPDEYLRQTINAQPGLFVVSVASMAAIAEASGKKPESELGFVAGHSVGEYAALFASGALSFSDALKLVRERGRLMHEACKEHDGSMAAILGLDLPSIEQLCQQTGVEIANINCDGQIVVSGERQALIKTIDLSRDQGAKKATLLEVSGAFHSRLMQPAVPGMIKAVENTTFRDSTVPVISNVTGEPLQERDSFKRELVSQIFSTVRWSQSVENMVRQGIDTFVDVGPGDVLTRLMKRIAKDAKTFSVGDIAGVQKFSSAIA